MEGDDQGMRAQHLVHAGALNTDAASVHETHLTQALRVCFLEVGIDNVGDVARRERVEVELRADGDDVGRIH